MCRRRGRDPPHGSGTQAHRCAGRGLVSAALKHPSQREGGAAGRSLAVPPAAAGCSKQLLEVFWRESLQLGGGDCVVPLVFDVPRARGWPRCGPPLRARQQAAGETSSVTRPFQLLSCASLRGHDRPLHNTFSKLNLVMSRPAPASELEVKAGQTCSSMLACVDMYW